MEEDTAGPLKRGPYMNMLIHRSSVVWRSTLPQRQATVNPRHHGGTAPVGVVNSSVSPGKLAVAADYGEHFDFVNFLDLYAKTLLLRFLRQ